MPFNRKSALIMEGPWDHISAPFCGAGDGSRDPDHRGDQIKPPADLIELEYKKL